MSRSIKTNLKESQRNIDNTKIKNIESAEWFQTIYHYPKTIGHMKLLISIVDKIGIFDKYDIAKISEMESNKLNIMYAILRIMNKVFNKYSDYVVKKTFRDGLKDIFSCTNLTYYDLFFDQLTQDIDHFVCSIIKSDYPTMNRNVIEFKFVLNIVFT